MASSPCKAKPKPLPSRALSSFPTQSQATCPRAIISSIESEAFPHTARHKPRAMTSWMMLGALKVSTVCRLHGSVWHPLRLLESASAQCVEYLREKAEEAASMLARAVEKAAELAVVRDEQVAATSAADVVDSRYAEATESDLPESLKCWL